MKIPLLILINLSLFVSTRNFALLNPKIDLIDLKDQANAANNRYCYSVPCPRYTLNPTKIPKPFEIRDYENSYWLSTPWYPEVNGSCLANHEAIPPYYNHLLNYFEGLNSMGLRFERTRPVRIVSRPDPKEDGMLCAIRFYIPDMYPMHPPASIVIDVILGWDKDRLCYVVGKRGPITWTSAKKVFKSMKAYLKRLSRSFPEDAEIMVDAFTGYGVSADRRYMEVLVCQEGEF